MQGRQGKNRPYAHKGEYRQDRRRSIRAIVICKDAAPRGRANKRHASREDRPYVYKRERGRKNERQAPSEIGAIDKFIVFGRWRGGAWNTFVFSILPFLI